MRVSSGPVIRFHCPVSSGSVCSGPVSVSSLSVQWWVSSSESDVGWHVWWHVSGCSRSSQVCSPSCCPDGHPGSERCDSALFLLLCSLVWAFLLVPNKDTKPFMSFAPTASIQTRMLLFLNWPMRRSTFALRTPSWLATGALSTAPWTGSSIYGNMVRTRLFFSFVSSSWGLKSVRELLLLSYSPHPPPPLSCSSSSESFSQRAGVRAALAQDPSWTSEYISKAIPMLISQDNEVTYLVPWSHLKRPPQEGGKPCTHTGNSTWLL